MHNQLSSDFKKETEKMNKQIQKLKKENKFIIERNIQKEKARNPELEDQIKNVMAHVQDMEEKKNY